VPKRVLVVFGTRPEAIKMAPVVEALRSRPGEFEVTVAVTAQHREMLDQVLALFGIVPDTDLDIMLPSQTLAQVTTRALSGLDPLIAELAPDAVLVQGDTTTTFAAALAAFYHKVPVGHVEAGLRTNDVYAPFPEEVNRRLTTQLTTWHFPPTATSAAHLLSEGVDPGRVHVTGNTVIDALLRVAELPYVFPPGPVADALASGRRIVLMTAHRRESWGTPMERVCEAAREIVTRFPDVEILFATHLNPVVREPVAAALCDTPRVTLLPPLDYLPFVKLMAASTLILSDSGGVQEEAPSLNVPALVMRDVTERPEAVEAGAVRLVGTDVARIVAEASTLLSDPVAYEQMASAPNPFGDGHAAERIADVLGGM
jgi:UDP-N-acetylglucosamine 2-epimerase (non-hydrolysing)